MTTTKNKSLPPHDAAYRSHASGAEDKNIGAYGMPIECHKSYKDKDREMLAQIIDWFTKQNKDEPDEKKHKTQAWLSRLSRISSTTANLVLKGKYSSSPTAQLQAMLSAIEEYEHKESSGQMPFVKTGIYRVIASTCQRASQQQNFGVVSGFVGVGKTSAIKQYAYENKHTYVIEADPSMTPSVLVDEIMTALKIGVHEKYGKKRTLHARYQSIILELRGSVSTLIIDEAETMTNACLHYLRRIRDKASVGIVLVGTENLRSLIAPEHGEFDQIRSRVTMWTPVIKSISEKDTEVLATAAFKVHGIDVEADVIQVLREYSKGSARMLLENLIPSVVDFGIKAGHELTPDLVHNIAEQILNLKG